ncbi:MAG: YiiD C-terminal domain-containing protein [Pseudomonadales bacterium]
MKDADRQQLQQALTDFVTSYLPLANAMRVSVDDYDGKSLSLSAPLEHNINDKQTAFGGSLFCLSVMCCWGMAYVKCLAHGIKEPNIVVSHAEIDYLAPVNCDILTASCRVELSDFESFFQYYDQHGKARIDLVAMVNNAQGQAVSFKGRYAILDSN